MGRHDSTANTTATFPVGDDLDPSGLHAFDQIVPNLVRHRFVIDAFTAERLEVELQALQFDTDGIGLESDEDLAEIGVTGHRTDRCELLVEVLDQERCRIRGRENFKQGMYRASEQGTTTNRSMAYFRIPYFSSRLMTFC